MKKISISKILTGIFLSVVSALIVLAGSDITAFAVNTDVSAKAAIVADSRTGQVLFSKNADEKLPMASTTKIMSAVIALEQKGLDDVFTVDSEAIKVEGSSMGLKEGDRVTLRDLCCGMLLPSGNDAANAAAVRISGSVENFVALMNKKAKELGMNSTHFVTPSGLDDYTDEHYSTAYDMAKLTAYALKNDDFRKICSSKSIKLKFGNPPYERWLTNSNKLLKNLEGCTGVKTGFTDKARRCLVSACERNGAELIAVTLNDPDDWQDHKNLYENCFARYRQQAVTVDCKNLYVNVVGGISDRIKCRCGGAVVSLPEGEEKNVTVKINLPHFVYAPVKKGEKAGRADFYFHGKKIAESDIFTAEDCSFLHTEEKGFFRKLFEKLFGQT